jgi:hypothetical protein
MFQCSVGKSEDLIQRRFRDTTVLRPTPTISNGFVRRIPVLLILRPVTVLMV